MTTRTLLTGATGFVGPHVRAQIDCVPLGPLDDPVDLRDSEAVHAAVAETKPEHVIHLAAQSFVPASFDDPLDTFQVNFIGTFHLLQALKETGFAGRMLYVGSGDMYGLVAPELLPITETCPLRPRNPYAVSKVAAEMLCYQWSQTERFEIVMARPLNHLGPGQSDRFAVASFAAQLAAIKKGRQAPELIVGDLNTTRDFLDVRDVVQAYALLLERGRSGEAYNVCSGVERSLHWMLEQLLALCGVDVEVRVDPRRLRPNEHNRVCGSHDKLTHATGWQPQVPIETSLRDLWNYWMEQPIG
jgi:GDP-4-dehydro-6-deoxy-D-mannose reductase